MTHLHGFLFLFGTTMCSSCRSPLQFIQLFFLFPALSQTNSNSRALCFQPNHRPFHTCNDSFHFEGELCSRRFRHNSAWGLMRQFLITSRRFVEEVVSVTRLVDPSSEEKGMFELPCCLKGRSLRRVNSSQQREYATVFN